MKPQWVAGHSLGEYSALVTAGVLSLRDAVVAVRRRGQYMQEAVPVGEGAMAAILALDLAAIEQACREAAQGQVVSPANINSPGQVVIAGHAAAVDRASELCKKAGAKRAIRLPVSAPFHCALMMPAQERLARDLAALSFAAPAVPLVNNVDATVVRAAVRLDDTPLTSRHISRLPDAHAWHAVPYTAAGSPSPARCHSRSSPVFRTPTSR